MSAAKIDGLRATVARYESLAPDRAGDVQIPVPVDRLRATLDALDASEREAERLRGERDQARRAALEEAIAVCDDRCKTAAETSDHYHRLAAEAGRAGDDARWRERMTSASVAGAIGTTARQIGDVLRALLDAPAPAVKP